MLICRLDGCDAGPSRSIVAGPSRGEKGVRSFAKTSKNLLKSEDGAALIEYTVLLGIMIVAVIAVIAAVGTWIGGRWTALNANLPA